MSYEEQILALQIPGADEAARAEAHERWNAVAKPIGSLGLLETDIERIAACTGSADIDIAKRAVRKLPRSWPRTWRVRRAACAAWGLWSGRRCFP